MSTLADMKLFRENILTAFSYVNFMKLLNDIVHGDTEQIENELYILRVIDLTKAFNEDVTIANIFLEHPIKIKARSRDVACLKYIKMLDERFKKKIKPSQNVMKFLIDFTEPMFDDSDDPRHETTLNDEALLERYTEYVSNLSDDDEDPRDCKNFQSVIFYLIDELCDQWEHLCFDKKDKNYDKHADILNESISDSESESEN